MLAARGHYADQEWFVHFRGPSGVGGTFILQSKSTGRYLASKTADDWSTIVTRPAQGNDWEEWHLASTAR